MNGELRFLHSVKEEKNESKRYSRSLCPRAAFITYLSHLSPQRALLWLNLRHIERELTVCPSRAWVDKVNCDIPQKVMSF